MMQDIGLNLTMTQYRALKKGKFVKLLPKHLQQGPYRLIANPYTQELIEYALINRKPIVWSLHDDESMSVMLPTDLIKELNR